jgi:hypothetical protein
MKKFRMFFKNKFLIAVGSVLLVGCSTNFGKYQLLNEFEKTKKLKKNDSMKVNEHLAIFNQNTYLLPAKVVLTKNNGSQVNASVLRISNDDIVYINTETNFLEKINKSQVSVSQVQSVELNYSLPEDVDIYFSTSEIKKEYEVISFYHWAPLMKGNILRKSLYKHWKNARWFHADAMIIEPNLVNSVLIRYIQSN